MRQSYSTLIHRLNFWLAIVHLGCAGLALTSIAHAADQTTENIEPQTAIVNPQQLQMQELAAKLNPSELFWLGENDDTFIALYRPALKPSQMAVILLPDSLHKLVQQNVLKTLYTELPEKGWSTLHIALPTTLEKPTLTVDVNKDSEPNAETSAEDTANTKQDEAIENPPVKEDTFADRKKAVDRAALKRIGSGINFLLEKDAKAITLVAENLSAPWSIATAIQEKDRISGLVLWQVNDAQFDQELLKELSDSRITILDIVDQSVPAEAKAQRIRRFKLAGFEDDYRQITSPYGPIGIEHSQRRVRQWLETGFQKY